MRLLGVFVAVAGVAAHGDEDLRLRVWAARALLQSEVHAVHAVGIACCFCLLALLVQRRMLQFFL